MSTSFPEPANLPSQPQLPDPLTFLDGSPVKSPQVWPRRRDELKALFQHYVYGTFPPPPAHLTFQQISSTPILNNTATHRIVLITFGPTNAGTPSLTIRLSMIIPHSATPASPAPVILNLYRGNKLPDDDLWTEHELPPQRGYIVATFANVDLDPDDADRSNGLHTLYPNHDFASLAAWAYGIHRCVDFLLTQPYVDPSKIALTGHSRRGKAALLAAAFDERIALVAPSGSGCGGVAASRLVQIHPNSETIRDITDPKRFHYWFHPRFAQFADHPDKLPIDQHLLLALIAPRPLMNSDGLDDHWADPLGTQHSMLAVLPVYQFLSPLNPKPLGSTVGLHFRPGGHGMKPEDWTALLDFADQNLLHKKVDRKFDTLPFPQTISHSTTP